jgi:hypothetical protein
MQVLQKYGYTQRFFRRVSERRPPRASCWEGPDGAVLDLHVCDPRIRAPWDEVSIIDRMLDQPALRVLSQDRFWMLPTPEAMVVHAVHHAHIGAASSDRMQTIMDIARLLPRSDVNRVMALANDVNLGALTLSLCTQAGDLAEFSVPTVVEVSPARKRRDYPRPIGRAVQVLWDAPGVIVERWPTRREFVALWSVRDLRRGLYALWLLGGRMRPIERAVTVGFGGFIKPQGTSADLGRDRRRRVVTPPHLRGRPVVVTVISGDPYAQLLFIDGKSHGVLDGTARVRLSDAPPALEVSLRLLGDPPEMRMVRAVRDDVRIVIAPIGIDATPGFEGSWT